MRQPVDAVRVRALLDALGRAASGPLRVYLTGGATAVLTGWRASTLDVDLTFEPEAGAPLRALQEIKERLELNVELASPAHFIPELPGWRERCLYIDQLGPLTAFHYDPYAQTLSKIERDHATDRVDVAELLGRRLVEPQRLRALFDAIQPELHRYPAIDPPSFARALAAALARHHEAGPSLEP